MDTPPCTCGRMHEDTTDRCASPFSGVRPHARIRARPARGISSKARGSRVLVDIGPGIVAQLLRHHHPDELDAVLVSHMHADHMLDLVTLRYVYPLAAARGR